MAEKHAVEKRDCPYCDEGTASMTIERQDLRYGAEDAVVLPIKIPVFTCDTCGLSFADWRAEEIRQKAVDDYLRSKK